jgi:hypothetical protein
MSQTCEMFDKCGFFNKFDGNPEVVKQGLIRLYCMNEIKSDTCERKKYRKKMGCLPPDNMSPTGKLLA